MQGLAATYKKLSEDDDGSYYLRTNPQLTEGKTENYDTVRMSSAGIK